jgi:hypothetical protein
MMEYKGNLAQVEFDDDAAILGSLKLFFKLRIDNLWRVTNQPATSTDRRPSRR